MAFHSKSIVAFGQLLVQLSAGSTNEAPLAAMLDVVRTHFAARAVVLSHPDPTGERRLSADSANAGLEGSVGTGCPTRAAPLREMLEHHQHVSASEMRLGGAEGCTLWIFRDRQDARFDNEETALVGLVLSQIARTLDLRDWMEITRTENSLYADALASLHVGVIIADETGRVVSASALAKSRLAARNGIQMQSGRLRAINVGEDRELQDRIRAACEGCAPRGLSLTTNAELRTLGVVVRPAPAAGLVCLYLRDFDTEPQMESEIVRQILDLTPAEAAMTHRLAAGLSLEDAAIALDISRNTARAHLRSIFSKNGISRQTDLVRMVLGSAAILGATPALAPSVG